MHNAIEGLIQQERQEKPLGAYYQGLVTLYKYLRKEINVIWYNYEDRQTVVSKSMLIPSTKVWITCKIIPLFPPNGSNELFPKPRSAFSLSHKISQWT